MEDLGELIEELEFINGRERTVEELLSEEPKEAYRVDYNESHDFYIDARFIG